MQIETVMEVCCNAVREQWLVFVEGNHDGWAGYGTATPAHLHNAYMEFSSTGNVNHVGFRCGAYKQTDELSRDAAGNVIADLRMPMVIFSPVDKDMLYFEHFHNGVETLLTLRREWGAHPSFKTDAGRLQALLGA